MESMPMNYTNDSSLSSLPQWWPQAIAEAQTEAKRRQNAYVPFGACESLQSDSSPEVLISGAARTGKSRACLEKIKSLAENNAGFRGLIVRKSRTSLSETGLVTLERDVLGLDYPSVASGAQRRNRSVYQISNNGSVLVIGGLDRAERILSSEYDVIYAQQAEELELTDWELLITRLSGTALPQSEQQLIGDCNPSAPTHWLKRRADSGTLRMLNSRHEDNPLLYDLERGEYTDYGVSYIAKLDRLTGARLQQLRYGRWVQAEGIVFTEWQPAIHLINRFEIPEDWRRVRVIDFGHTNPFICQWWAVDHDDHAYMYREIYMTKRTVRAHSQQINKLSDGETFEDSIADHDAEDRATLSENGIDSIAADKRVSVGIEAVQERLKMRADGEPGMFIMRDSLVEVDNDLVEASLPFCTEQEINSYVWAKNKETPLKKNDHGVDSLRYLAMYLGPGIGGGISLGFA